MLKEECHVNAFDYTKGPECYGSNCPGKNPNLRFRKTNMMGVLAGKTDDLNPLFLPSRVHGHLPVKKRQINAFDDQCSQAPGITTLCQKLGSKMQSRKLMKMALKQSVFQISNLNLALKINAKYKLGIWHWEFIVSMHSFGIAAK